MKLKTSIPLFWLPLIAFWTFLSVLQANLGSKTLEEFIPLMIYLIVSFLFVIQLQLVIVSKRESWFVKLGTANILFCSLFLSSIFILLRQFNVLNNEWSTGLIIVPLISNTIIAELLSFSNQEIQKKKNSWNKTNQRLEALQVEKSKRNSKEKELYLQYRKEWDLYIEQAIIDYAENAKIMDELRRIQEIIEFSSFFRSKRSLETLSKLKSSEEFTHKLLILKSIK